MPRVSVVTGAYNQESVIRDTLNSVLGQTYNDFEYVVIDDGSTDSTGDILDEFSGRITLIHQANQGNVVSRNRAIDASSGELIAVIDGDDVWNSCKLELQVAAFDRDPAVGLSYTSMVEMGPQGGRLSAPLFTDISADPIRWQLLTNACPFSSMLVRREALPLGRLLDPRFNLVGDRYLTLQVALQGYAFHALADPPILLRTHAASMRYSHGYRKDYLDQTLAALEDVGSDERFPRSHRVWMKQAVAAAYLSSAWLAIDRGSLDEFPRAALELARCLSSDPSRFPEVVRQGVKMTLRASGIRRAALTSPDKPTTRSGRD